MAGAIDLRSDTFTVPDAGMREAMARAEVGDDVWGEDPTVHRLENEVAGRLAKEAAVFVPSGTMGNLIAIAAQTHPGDEVLLDREAHIVVYEVGGAPLVAGVQLRFLEAPLGCPDAADVEAGIRNENIHHPVSRLLCVENTHNRRGGAAVSAAQVGAAASAARRHGLRVHCDGARLFNAAVALAVPPSQLVAACDSVTVCLSKGLGAPVGSVLAGDGAFIAEARRWRKRLGGGMRQAGILAAGGLYALAHNEGRLADDHANARLLARVLSEAAGVTEVRAEVPTNIVLLRTERPAVDLAAQAAAAGVLVTVMDAHLLRCMTYLGVTEADVRRAADVLRGVFDGARVPA